MSTFTHPITTTATVAASTYNNYQQGMQSQFQEFVITNPNVHVPEHVMCNELPQLQNNHFAYDRSNIYSVEDDSVYFNDTDISSGDEIDHMSTAYDDAPLRECGGGNMAVVPAPYTLPYDPRLAALRVFISILLHSWRKRRKEIKQLRENVEYLRGVSLHARTQIHLFNKLFRSEQRRNNKLMCQLKDSVESVSNAKSSCDDLATSVISLKADKALMDQELRVKSKDYEELNAVFVRTKGDLYQALVEQRILESSLCKEKRTAKNIEDQRDKLINELGLLRAENEQVQEKYRSDLKQKENELQSAINTIKSLERTVTTLQEKAERVDEFCESDVVLHKEIDELQQQVAQLENSLKQSLDYRLRDLWSGLLKCQKRALTGIHNVAFYLLPATPAPRVTA